MLGDAGSTVTRWSEAGLLVSLAVFLLVVWHIWRRKHRAEHERVAQPPARGRMMSEKTQGQPFDELLDHDYDGIKEYDNPLPFWWVALFWVTIVFSAVYFIFFHFGPGSSIHDQHSAGMMELYDLQAKELLKLGPVTDETLLKMASDVLVPEGPGLGVEVDEAKVGQVPETVKQRN